MHSILLFHANLAATNLALAVDTETGMNVYIFFPFIVLTDRNLNIRPTEQWQENSHSKGVRSPCKEYDPTVLFITGAAS